MTDTSTYGQTFTAPTTNVLNDFTSYLGIPSTAQSTGSGPIQYQADVYAWDGTKATGSALFTSTHTYTLSGSGYVPVLTSTGGTTLTAGQQYVSFLTTAGLQSGQPSSTVSWETTDYFQSAYAGGQFVYISAGNDASKLTTTSWANPIGGGDLAFNMNFSPHAPVSPAPEPSSVAVWAFVGIGGAGLALKARKRKAAA